MEGFLLGLASGITCVASCAPVMIPLFLGGGRRVGQNGWLLAQFLLGRLAGYLLFGLLAGLLGNLILRGGGPAAIIFAGIYILTGTLLLLFGLAEFVRIPRPIGILLGAAGSTSPEPDPGPVPDPLPGCPVPPRELARRLRSFPALFPLALGFLTGLNLCAPFVAAFTAAAGQGTLAGSLFFFVMFFAGTAVFFLPIPFVGAFHRVTALRTIGRFAAILMALYYLYTGLIQFVGGITL
jgi:sulfite exporter TauE/SafE